MQANWLRPEDESNYFGLRNSWKLVENRMGQVTKEGGTRFKQVCGRCAREREGNGYLAF